MTDESRYDVLSVKNAQDEFLRARRIYPQPEHAQSLVMHMVSTLGTVVSAYGDSTRYPAAAAARGKSTSEKRIPPLAALGVSPTHNRSSGSFSVDSSEAADESKLFHGSSEGHVVRTAKFSRFERRRLAKHLADIILDATALCSACDINLVDPQNAAKPLPLRPPSKPSPEADVHSASLIGDDFVESDSDTVSESPQRQSEGYTHTNELHPTIQVDRTSPLAITIRSVVSDDGSPKCLGSRDNSLHAKLVSSVAGSQADLLGSPMHGVHHVYSHRGSDASDIVAFQEEDSREELVKSRTGSSTSPGRVYPGVPQVATPSMSASSQQGSSSSLSSTQHKAAQRYRRNLEELMETIKILDETGVADSDLEEMNLVFAIPVTQASDNGIAEGSTTEAPRWFDDLKPGGSGIRVTRSNWEEFKELVAHRLEVATETPNVSRRNSSLVTSS